jgi:hypothetical protein
MRYLVKAKVKPAQEKSLLAAIEAGTLGRGSVAGDEYLDDMAKARVGADGICTWVEVCFCATPLQEERPYWEQFFDLLHIKDAHARKNCRDANGTQPWACCNCDCTQKLEQRLQLIGDSFLKSLKKETSGEDLETGGRQEASLRSSTTSIGQAAEERFSK